MFHPIAQEISTHEVRLLGHHRSDSGRGGGKGPPCPRCGEPMAPADDHGRFICFCRGIGAGIRDTFDAISGAMLPPPRPIRQVDTTGMTNAQKARVPPINRLHQPMTEAEQRYAEVMAGGPDAIGTPEYEAAVEALDKERGEA